MGSLGKDGVQEMEGVGYGQEGLVQGRSAEEESKPDQCGSMEGNATGADLSTWARWALVWDR